jgi:transmembrane sensor
MTDTTMGWDELSALPPAEAAALIVDRLEREETSIDPLLVDRWLAESEEHREAFSRARDVWDGFADWTQSERLSALRAQAVAGSFRRPARRWLPVAAAASVAALITTGGILAVHMRGVEPGGSTEVASAERFGGVDLSVAPGEEKAVDLPDGTRAVLSQAATLDLAFSDKLRLVRIGRGAVRFDVHHDATRPFRVAVADRVIADLGTRFSVAAEGTGVRIHLIEGLVAVGRGSDPAAPMPADAFLLHPGQSLVTRAGSPDIVTGKQTPAPSATPKKLVFHEEPLLSALAQMNRTSPVHVEADPRLAGYRISGVFRGGDARPFARTLAELYPFKVATKADGNLLLTPKKGR